MVLFRPLFTFNHVLEHWQIIMTHVSFTEVLFPHFFPSEIMGLMLGLNGQLLERSECKNLVTRLNVFWEENYMYCIYFLGRNPNLRWRQGLRACGIQVAAPSASPTEESQRSPISAVGQGKVASVPLRALSGLRP